MKVHLFRNDSVPVWISSLGSSVCNTDQYKSLKSENPPDFFRKSEFILIPVMSSLQVKVERRLLRCAATPDGNFGSSKWFVAAVKATDTQKITHERLEGFQ